MRTWVEYTGPPGSEEIEPTVLAEDALATHKFNEGAVIYVKPAYSGVSRDCRIEEIKTNRMCMDGRRANVLVVRPLSTLN